MGRYLCVVVASSAALICMDYAVGAIERNPNSSSLAFRHIRAHYGAYLAVVSITAVLYQWLNGLASQLHKWFDLSQRGANAALIGGATLYPFYTTGQALASGDWIAAQPFAFAIPLVTTLLGALLSIGLVLIGTSKQRDMRLYYIIACGAGSLFFFCLDSFVFPSLYSSFHELVFGVSVVLMFLCAEALIPSISDHLPRRVTIGLHSFFIVLVIASLYTFVTLKEKSRGRLLSRSRTATYIFSAVRLYERPPYLEVILDRIDTGRPVISETIPRSKGRRPISKDWNIVVLIMDAMRADTLPPNRQENPSKHHARKGDTPFLDRLVSTMYRFKFAYSPSNGTKMSMPSIFTGLIPPRLRKEKGDPISSLMNRAGRRPIAVANRLFSSRRKKLKSLLKGYEDIAYYSDKKQRRAVKTMLKAVDAVKDKPFFAWFHFYALHNPYHGKKGIQRDGSAPFPVRYRNALRWSDGEVRKLIGGFDKRGLTQRTLFVLTADHGEGLGDHRLMTHGSFLFEEEVRVPLYIRFPGRRGATISSTVSLLDLVPTLMDLVGRPVSNSDGNSLRPLLDNPKVRWQKYYYLENLPGNQVAIVTDRVKLIYFTDIEIMSRYDLKKDTSESRNLFSIENDNDQMMLSHLIYHRPELFLDELSEKRLRSKYKSLLARLNTLPKQAARLLERIESARKATSPN